MNSQERKQSKNQQMQETSTFSDVPAQGMLESHPFVVQSKNNNSEQSNLRTSLIQAEKYGHHLSKTDLTNQSASTTVQTKPDLQPVQLAKTPKIKHNTSRAKPYDKQKTSTIKEDEATKQLLGHVPGTFLHPKKPTDRIGTHAGQYKKFKQTPSGNKVEADHMTPDSLHQPLGQKRNTTDGRALSTGLPAAQLPYELHRRKNTTGSGKEVEHQRAYLLRAHHGQVPFAGVMDTSKDHYAAAMEIDLRNTFVDRAVFGKPSSLDPRNFPPTHKQGMAIPFKDMVWSAERIKEMIHESNRQERISSGGKTHLNSVVEEQLEALRGRLP
ncbi:hypothetical protein [Nodularia sphaerocarpa]|uniref:hypothetical protein n=1 Tax=Nodularia sphaerocarpa TaxID=137816 RepID=UPI001EFB447B|nr:hypothetical protein [Nodularia sphaerocarpa]MDB9373336.1 hypothetical protein [Nodularia sphaerocarpa CS-585]MDB9379664.1 hypothetical protein [Nodularia sphaerocarpa CS-585A2]ULP71925.1 hypothetical protein BDGGKGIB_01562 [Nodularia sphaerocarpa UHCC 0038]